MCVVRGCGRLWWLRCVQWCLRCVQACNGVCSGVFDHVSTPRQYCCDTLVACFGSAFQANPVCSSNFAFKKKKNSRSVTFKTHGTNSRLVFDLRMRLEASCPTNMLLLGCDTEDIVTATNCVDTSFFILLDVACNSESYDSIFEIVHNDVLEQYRTFASAMQCSFEMPVPATPPCLKVGHRGWVLRYRLFWKNATCTSWRQMTKVSPKARCMLAQPQKISDEREEHLLSFATSSMCRGCPPKPPCLLTKAGHL